MLNVRLRKVLRDLWVNDTRTLLAILAMAVGIFGVGSVLSATAILTREIAVNFAGTNPASATLFVEGATAALARRIEQVPGVSAATARRAIQGRVRAADGGWRPVMLFVIDDFSALRVSTFALERGQPAPGVGQLLIERSSNVRNEPGDRIVVRTALGQDQPLDVVGVVHDPGRAPGWQDGLAYAYITTGTAAMLGETPALNELRIVVGGPPQTVAQISEVAYRVKDELAWRGLSVTQVVVHEPGRHPHADQMDSLLFMLQTFGVLTLLLAAALVAGTVAALLAQQTRQMGVMKAIGASSRQIAGLYFATVLLIGAVALLVGIPAGQVAGRAFAGLTATLLNFNIISDAIPAWVIAAQVAISLSVPALAAAFPIMLGSRRTVRELLAAEQSVAPVEIRFARQRPGGGEEALWLLSLRNTFRKRGRLLLTLGILAIGGATFISAQFIGASWSNSVENSFLARRYDLEIRLARPYPAARLDATLTNLPGLAGHEDWAQSLAFVARPDGSDGARFYLTALPVESELVAFPVIEGRWLRPGDTNALVINHELLNDHDANIHLGDTVALKIGNQTVDWVVVGVVREVGAPRRGLGVAASAYVPLAYFSQATHADGMSTNIRAQTAAHDDAAIQTVIRQMEQRFDAGNIQRTTIQATTERKLILQNHLVVIITFLLLMAVLMTIVGGLALASSISISVLERVREFAVLRAIGASTGAILRIVMIEGLVIGMLSALLAVLLAWPISTIVGNMAGQIFIGANLDHAHPPGAVALWLGLSVVISLLASAAPAWNAAQMTVRDGLAYE